MYKLKYILLLLCCACYTVKAGIKHPLHVSTTEINFNAKDKSLEVSCRIFSDDFEAILAKLYKQKIDLGNADMKTEMDGLVKKYLLSHLQLKANGKAAVLNYIGFEIDHEATNIYLEVEKITAIRSVEVNDTILYDMFDDQMSIVHVVKGSMRKSTKILYPEKKFTANF
ncbi:DUF6702 family protein [Pedobacter zeae]|uniref:Peptidase E n=1 Tax=Pedobacter zeae TaxID=1737356 RepID=A0A7W6KDI4_9SPHI|nr:DUF6702 family protein [Pedobacter zeae]MBB4109803.1 hypothetical protein [Pedobacter zeae]GGH14324.1 hypothetical protein GCM10007422_35570 [Pedobacter zeae]